MGMDRWVSLRSTHPTLARQPVGWAGFICPRGIESHAGTKVCPPYNQLNILDLDYFIFPYPARRLHLRNIAAVLADQRTGDRGTD